MTRAQVQPPGTRTRTLCAVAWDEAARGVRLLDQTRLPAETVYVTCTTIEQVHDAIQRLVVRGAPAIGIAAAFGTVIGVQSSRARDFAEFASELARVTDYLATSRPTAVNLFGALERVKRAAHANRELPVPRLIERLLTEARAILDEDIEMCRQIGRHGAALISDGDGVLTHCNAGSLATGGSGTALSVIYAAVEAGKRVAVYVGETRPLLQGSRLSAYELRHAGIDVTIICDAAAAQVMREGRVQAVITGADRIAANGDTANKIGTYALAVLAEAHEIPFYVAAPSTTFDLSLAGGAEIPIEQRDGGEITRILGHQIAPADVNAYNPAFDVTPARYISAIVTEQGVLRPPLGEAIAKIIAPLHGHTLRSEPINEKRKVKA